MLDISYHTLQAYLRVPVGDESVDAAAAWAEAARLDATESAANDDRECVPTVIGGRV